MWFCTTGGLDSTVSEHASTGELALYLAGVTGLSVASIATLYALSVTGFPQFLSGFGQDPAVAVQSDPVTPALALTGLGLVVVLVAAIVVFGARYGPNDPDRKQTVESDTGDE